MSSIRTSPLTTRLNEYAIEIDSATVVFLNLLLSDKEDSLEVIFGMDKTKTWIVKINPTIFR